MDSASSNHYEQQLYTVFKTFDVANEEALDRSAVLELCDTLQLEDRGEALVDTLFDRQADRVTFSQFRNGLLGVLGSEASPQPNSSGPEFVAPPTRASPAQSDDDSSGREVAPKFVFGSKKYGRRSRPQRTAPETSPRHRVASESRLDSSRARQRMRCKRSASAMESRDDDAADLEHNRRVDRTRALALCRGLQMHGVDHRIIDRIFETSSSEEISVGDFFDRLNASLTTSIAVSLDGVLPGESAKMKSDVVSSDAVVETWERAGVQRPRRLLIELGFTAAALYPHELESALDDELRALASPPDAPPEARSLLLLAAHVLARMRLESAWRLLDVARAERDKLRDDLTEANRRARLLAQDVDENHARIEADLNSTLRQMETRHAEALRASTAEAATERERAAVSRLALDEETARRMETEACLRTEVDALRVQIEELQEHVKTADAHASLAEREKARLMEEALEAEGRNVELVERERAVSAELSARIHDIRIENQHLRDRNDELCEASEASAQRVDDDSALAPSWREEVAMQAKSHEAAKDKNQTSELVTKENKLYLSEIIGQLRLVLNDMEQWTVQSRDECCKCATMGQSMTILRKLVNVLNEEMIMQGVQAPCVSSNMEMGSQTDLSFGKEVEVLRNNLIDVKQRYERDKQNMSSVIKELESSLEQLKSEYDKCEEYWTCKLEDERDLFAEEQRAGDERLAELVAKIAEYERQFERALLPPIAETRGLETQVTDLEQEFAAYRAGKEAEASSQAEKIDQLKQKLEDLQHRQSVGDAASVEPSGERSGERRAAPECAYACARCGAGCGAEEGAGGARWRAAASAREAAALRARAARAERAAQRLHSRLAAADLLVKDLYIENCRLAHHTHHPRLP